MRSSVLRVICVNICVICLVFFCGFLRPHTVFTSTVVQKEKANKNKEVTTEAAPVPEAEVTSQPDEAPTESSVTVSQQSEVEKATSAEIIKGKIISQYSSPYLAKDSCENVYLKNNTGLKISLQSYLEKSINFKIEKSGEPQVLILHTHATETFKTDDNDYFTADFTSRSRDNSVNMVSVGKIVAQKLNSVGITTLHDTTLHDYPSYTQSYSRSAATVNEYIKKYPSIKVVLDLHRDAVTNENGDKVKLVTEINGKKAAQVMLVQGSQSGGVTNFPHWEENFTLALKLQNNIEKNYPTLARPLMLMSKNYNQSLTTGSLLIEFGTDANTLSEVHYSAELVGSCLAELLSTIN